MHCFRKKSNWNAIPEAHMKWATSKQSFFFSTGMVESFTSTRQEDIFLSFGSSTENIGAKFSGEATLSHIWKLGCPRRYVDEVNWIFRRLEFYQNDVPDLKL